ncbi:MAG TPA: ATP-binding protein [Gemmatimonadales bacterium]|nr:ATP-binding protein [Gemmatimonadales bacterium]
MNLIAVATILSGATNLALAFSFFYAWQTILRRRYVALLAVAATFGVAELLLQLPQHLAQGRGAAAAYVAAAAAGSFGTVAWVGGCYDFVRRRIPWLALGAAFTALVAWSIIGPQVTGGFFARESPDSLIKGALGLWIAVTFWRGPAIGVRGVLTALFALQGLHQLDYPFLADKTWGVIAGLAVSDFLGITISVFLLIVVIEEARRETLAANESLRRAEAMAEMGELVGGVAHEVRNPLMAISSGLQTLAVAEADAAARRADIFDDLKSAVTRLTTLTRDLLEYGKPTDPDLQPGDAAAVIRSAAVACAPLATAAGVRIRIDAGDPVPTAVMDRSRLIQVFVNLITNAVQHSPAGGEVRVTIRQQGGGGLVECEVADSGPGFPDDLLPHLFHPFAGRRPGGTGLGLAIARRLVEQQRGTVAAQNRPDGGAFVRVTLSATRMHP